MSNFMWNLIPQSFISTNIVYISNIFTSQEPTVFECTCSIKKNLRIVLEKFYSVKFSRVLLRMVGLQKLIFYKVFLIVLGHVHTLLNL